MEPYRVQQLGFGRKNLIHFLHKELIFNLQTLKDRPTMRYKVVNW